MLFRAVRICVDIRNVRRHYDKYRVLNVKPKLAIGIDLDELFDQDLLWAQAIDAGKLLQE